MWITQWTIQQTMESTLRESSCFLLTWREMRGTNTILLQSAGFLERFSRWLRRFNRIGMNLGAGNDFESIHAGNGMFMERAADGQTSIYQISCNLIYERMV